MTETNELEELRALLFPKPDQGDVDHPDIETDIEPQTPLSALFSTPTTEED